MKQILIAIDQLINTLIPPYNDAYADETISARSWRNGKTSKGWNAFRVLIDAIFFLDQQHCFTSYLSEAERNHLPEEYVK